MGAYLKKIVVLIFMLCCGLVSMAQRKPALAALGTVNKAGDYIFKRVNATKGITKSEALSLNKSLARQLDISLQAPVLNPPVGFSARSSFSVEAPGPFSDLIMPIADISILLSYLMKDAKTGEVQPEKIAYAYLDIQTNSLERWFSQHGVFWQDCNKLKIPLFFEQIPLLDSTADYIEIGRENPGDRYDVTNDPVRIIKRNNRPLFIPLTRREFLQFLMAKTTENISSSNEAIKSLQEGLAVTKKMQTDPKVPESDRAYVADGIKSIQNNIGQFQNNITHYRQQIKRYTDVMNAMTAQDAAAPARLDRQIKMDDFDLFEQLVPTGSPEGTLLCRVNPDYYDKSPDAPVAQLIFVRYVIPYSGLASPSYLGKKTVDFFDQLDYHQLKESIR